MHNHRQIKFRYFTPTGMIYQKEGEFWQISFKENNQTILKVNDQIITPVSQFTGQKTKDNSEVWEGDVVELGEHNEYPATQGKIGEVKWSEDWGTFVVEWKYNKHQHMLDLDCDVAFCLKVIGNLYENPELANQFSEGNLWR